MTVLDLLKFRRDRRAWADPQRRIATLESFGNTEEDGGRDLRAAARCISDAELRQHIERHAQDEERHAALFRRRAAELRAEGGGAGTRDEVDKPYDLSRGRPGLEVDAHGFFNAGLCDELGELAYVAMLHVAEQRAAELFEAYHAQNRHDPRTQEVFAEILKDEKYHVAYTGKFLEQWRRAGREREVHKALKEARSSRFMSAWKRVGLRAAAGFSKVVLFVMYWTLLVPFALIARRGSGESHWRPRESAPDADASLRQY